MTAAAGGWVVERRSGGVSALHGSWPPEDGLERRTLAVCAPTGGAALVLGSTQPDSLADPERLAAAAVELVHRRSGGGAVLVAPEAQAWIDAWVPRHDPLWEEDVVRAPQWLGDVWAAALGSLGVEGLSVHRHRAQPSAWSHVVCFAGIGPAEVSVGGRKVVGLAQRRTREGTRLYTMAPLRWDPEPLALLLALDADERRQALAGTVGVASGLADVVPAGHGESLLGAVERAVVEHLPDGEGPQ